MRKFLYNLATDASRGFLASVLKFLLFILSIVYGSFVRILILLNSSAPVKLGCKVISVGNITVGGTGKTVVVEYIARFLKSRGCKPAILSRGYRRKRSNHGSLAASFGDEPAMLKEKLKDTPVIVDADRKRGANKAIADFGCNAVILDDGFQQWRIKKDLDIVLIDSTDPFGNRHMLPRGILREPLSSLRRAGVFIITKTNINPDIEDIEFILSEINPNALIVAAKHRPLGLSAVKEGSRLFSLDILKGKAVALFSAIADPGSFKDLIGSSGASVVLSFEFDDHHYYSKDDLIRIAEEARKNKADYLVTTEKDAVKLVALEPDDNILALRIGLEVSNNEERFHNRLLELFSL